MKNWKTPHLAGTMDRAAQALLALADAVVCALDGEPIRFVREGELVLLPESTG
jgi:hypothetical protein